MINRRKLVDRLTEAFVQYQQMLEEPMTADLRLADERYRHDVVFRRRVDSLVSGVMRIVSEHCEEVRDEK